MNNHPFAQLLAYLYPLEMPKLISPDSSISQLASSEYVEYRLDESEQCDYLFSIQKPTNLSDYPIPESSKSILHKILNIYPNIPYIWVEFDDIKKKEHPLPGLHVCVSPHYLQTNPSNEHHEITAECIFSLLECLNPSVIQYKKNIIHIINKANYFGELIHVSAMQGRTPPSIKLFISLPENNLACFLQAIEWPGDILSVKQMLRNPWCEPDKKGDIRLDLKIDDQKLSPYIGIVKSKINLSEKTNIRIVKSLIEQEVISRQSDISVVMGWLSPELVLPYLRWIDIKTVIDTPNDPTYKLYFGLQKKRKVIWPL
ncbi:MAG: hypothetical protein OXE99_09915 [Cellvibrionales bacterium]|nr:hypothetical protein [Cellvibrionales bacterium]